ncbi:hypothetical protein BJ741DRAFT_577782 [Chytriomyces cf. hyalinus JEL632]|nr:hypothetical protein BJ741DRAFT_577782 [Chytriomyces cf. hyalinus JEL632]
MYTHNTLYDQLEVNRSANELQITCSYLKLHSESTNKSHRDDLTYAVLVLTRDRKTYEASLDANLSYRDPRDFMELDLEEEHRKLERRASDLLARIVKNNGTICGALAGSVLGFILAGPIGAVAVGSAAGAAGCFNDVHKMSPLEYYFPKDKTR